MNSILIVKTSSIGDVIQTFPVLDYLRLKYPSARIDWVVEKGCSQLLRSNPQLSNIHEIDTRRWRTSLFTKKVWQEIGHLMRQLRLQKYDLLIDLQGNCKSALVTLIARADVKVGFDWSTVAEKPNWFVTSHHYKTTGNVRERYLNLIKAHLQDGGLFLIPPVELKLSLVEQTHLQEIVKNLQGSLHLMVCFGSKWKNKQLKPETLVQLLKKIEGYINPFFVFIWASEQEKKFADSLTEIFPHQSVSVGDLSLNLWQALMAKMDGVFSVDSAALHLCATTMTPSFSVFGPSAASYYAPQHSKHAAYQGKCPYHRSFAKRCPLLRSCPTGACLHDLTVEELFASFMRWSIESLHNKGIFPHSRADTLSSKRSKSI